MLRPWGTQPVSSLPTCRELWLQATTPPPQVFSPHRGSTCPVSQAAQPAVPLLLRAAPRLPTKWKPGWPHQTYPDPSRLTGQAGGAFRDAPRLPERERETAARQEQKPRAVSFPKRRTLPASSLPLPATLFPPPPTPQLSVRSGFVSSLAVTEQCFSPPIPRPRGEVVPG